MQVPFNRPSITAAELEQIAEAARLRKLSGGGHFTRLSQQWLEQHTGAMKVLLTHSGTGALEMAALLSEIGPGDEVIMPSFTFSSTANAFVLRGAVPVFVDILPETLNLDPAGFGAALTSRTKAVVPVHYAGVSCDMTAINRIAKDAGLFVIEDAAQALLAEHDGQPLGSFGHAAALSFHETKNIGCGEGGALLLTDPAWADRAEILWEKGTNRSAFHRGQVDKYTWCDVGSSFLPSEITAAVLWAQLGRARQLTDARLQIWNQYHAAFARFEQAGVLRRPTVPSFATHNGHIYYLLLPTAQRLDEVLQALRSGGVDAVRHYVPLHSSPAGKRFGRAAGVLPVTDDLSARLLRLPLWSDMSATDVSFVIEVVTRVVTS
jgi:dTDP-4-amino-4,6-dideoxygalactose transaminase